MDLRKEETRSIVKVLIVDSEGECERTGLGVVSCMYFLKKQKHQMYKVVIKLLN